VHATSTGRQEQNPRGAHDALLIARTGGRARVAMERAETPVAGPGEIFVMTDDFV